MAVGVAGRKAKPAADAEVLISYQPAGCRKSGRGVAFEWPLPVVLRLVETGIAIKQKRRAPNKHYVVGYDRVGLRTLERVRGWLLGARDSGQPVVEVPSRGTPRKRYDMGGHMTVAGWFGRFVYDGRHRSVYCPWCRKSYPKDRLKFAVLGDCPSGLYSVGLRRRAPTGLVCPKRHVLRRH